MHTKTIDLDVAILQDVFGINDTNLKAIQSKLEVAVITRDGTVEIKGESPQSVKIAADTLSTLSRLRHSGELIDDFVAMRVI